MPRVFLSSRGGLVELLRRLLEDEFQVVDYRLRVEELETGDVLVMDLAEEASDCRGLVSDLRRSLPDGVRVLAVIRPDQLSVVRDGVEVDDFLLEGSSGEEARARVRRLARSGEAVRRPDGLVIDEGRYQVRVDGMPVELTFKEFELLRFLASHPGRVFTRQMLLEQVWGYDYFGGTRTVDVHVRRIRSKIEREGRTYIRTVRGVGYIFEPSETETF
ncbi:MAG: winged helix-turn-helix domain-containing protein [Actinomycetota bacterium]